MTPSFRSALIASALVALAAPPASAREIGIPFSPANFSNPLNIDNPYWPLVPVTTYIYRTGTVQDCELFTIEVTNRTRRVAGVRTRVIHEIAYDDPNCDGSLIKTEETDDYHAQDNAGNIWYFGEDTFDCTPDGSCTRGDGSWLAGVDGAVAGIIMLANPRTGDQYQQEFLAGVAEDQGKVSGTGVSVSLDRDDAVSPREFRHCLKIQDSSPLEPGSIEYKYYCPAQGGFGGGLVAVDEHHGSTVRFELVHVLGR